MKPWMMYMGMFLAGWGVAGFMYHQKQKQRKVVSGDIQDEGATPSISTIRTLQENVSWKQFGIYY